MPWTGSNPKSERVVSFLEACKNSQDSSANEYRELGPRDGNCACAIAALNRRAAQEIVFVNHTRPLTSVKTCSSRKSRSEMKTMTLCGPGRVTILGIAMEKTN